MATKVQIHRRPPSIQSICKVLKIEQSNVKAGLYGTRPIKQETRQRLREEYQRQSRLFAQYLEHGKDETEE